MINMSAEWPRPILAALQPSYLPWLGAFEQLARSDIFVVYDDVQYDRDGWRNRNRIKTAQGVQWLTVPVLTKGLFGQKIRDVLIDNRKPWPRKHLETLRQAYAKAPLLDSVMAELLPVLGQEWQGLSDLNTALFLRMARFMGLERTIRRSGEFALPEDKNDRLIELCQKLGAKTYYSGQAAKDYLAEDRFARAGIAVRWQEFQPSTYPQLHGEFVSHLSGVDWLFNCPDPLSFLS
jgi:hypothetical protein